ncbi:MAG: GNAT family N-acetyltransferase [Phycisphaeraceae bacterium]|nr:MAG: GNAT family N-acetyltransferase [Phycisphaeraceae bacterium]
MLEAPALPIVVRRVRSSDSMEELTSLLHRAYAEQVAMGLKPLAGRQTVDVTRARSATGENYVATLGEGGPLVGTILFQERESAAFPEWFLRPEVAHFSLFGVDPLHQGRGIGGMLLRAVEQRAVELAKTEIALSYAEPDTKLAGFYAHRAYRFIQHWQWPYTNYRSVILSKSLV